MLQVLIIMTLTVGTAFGITYGVLYYRLRYIVQCTGFNISFETTKNGTFRVYIDNLPAVPLTAAYTYLTSPQQASKRIKGDNLTSNRGELI